MRYKSRYTIHLDNSVDQVPISVESVRVVPCIAKER